MNEFDFFVGFALGVLFYHVFIIRFLNNPRFQKIKTIVFSSDNVLDKK